MTSASIAIRNERPEPCPDVVVVAVVGGDVDPAVGVGVVVWVVAGSGVSVGAEGVEWFGGDRVGVEVVGVRLVCAAET